MNIYDLVKNFGKKMPRVYVEMKNLTMVDSYIYKNFSLIFNCLRGDNR